MEKVCRGEGEGPVVRGERDPSPPKTVLDFSRVSSAARCAKPEGSAGRTGVECERRLGDERCEERKPRAAGEGGVVEGVGGVGVGSRFSVLPEADLVRPMEPYIEKDRHDGNPKRRCGDSEAYIVDIRIRVAKQ